MLIPLAKWTDPASRKRSVLEAIQKRDAAALLEFHAVYLGLHGKKRTKISPRTLIEYEAAILDFLEWVWPEATPAPHFQLNAASDDQVSEWLAALLEHGSHRVPPAERRALEPATAAKLLAGVRSFFKALTWAKVSTPITVVAPSSSTPPEERRPALPRALYKRLLERLNHLVELGNEESLEVRRDRLAVRLLGEAGLRAEELVGLETGHYEAATRQLTVTGKGAKTRTVPLGKTLAAELEDWLVLRTVQAKAGAEAVIINLGGRKRHGTAMTQQSLRRHLEAHYRALDFPERYYGAHMLRHTAGTRIYKATGDLFSTARLLGHRNVNTASIYAKMDLESLHEAVDASEELE